MFFNRLSVFIWASSGMAGTLAYRILACHEEGFYRFFAGGWLALALALLASGLVFMRRSARPDSVSLIGVLLSVALGAWLIFSLFVLVSAEYAGSDVWLWLGFVIFVGLAVGSLYPQIRARLALVLFSLLMTFVFAEGFMRLYMRLFPVDVAWPVVVDEHIGWRHYPNHERVWSGVNPACSSFRVPISINSQGFYDLERDFQKPEDSLRVAMVGDSFTEAMQVHFEDRASQLLERQLNESARLPADFEVLNFGISNFSVGQFMLTYQYYAADYDPDFVFAIVFGTQFLRSVPGSGYNVGEGMAVDALQIRPNFVSEADGSLRVIPPHEEDMRRYEALRDSVLIKDGEVQNRFRFLAPEQDPGGSFFEVPYKGLVAKSQFLRFMSFRLDALWSSFENQFIKPRTGTPQTLSYYDYSQGNWTGIPGDDDVIRLNLRILQEFDTITRENGTELVIANYADYPEHDILNYFAQDNYIGVVDLSAFMADESEPTHSLCDSHWNELGNRLAAEAMAEWLTKRLTEPYQIYGSAEMTLFHNPDGSIEVYRFQDNQGVLVGKLQGEQLSQYGAPWRVERTFDDPWTLISLLNPEGERVDSYRIVLN